MSHANRFMIQTQGISTFLLELQMLVNNTAFSLQ